jgi:hypothetical protein
MFHMRETGGKCAFTHSSLPLSSEDNPKMMVEKRFLICERGKYSFRRITVVTMNNGKGKQGPFTSLRGDWKTPRALSQALDAEFGFDYDPFPAKPATNGLQSDWGKINFVNPPYGKEITKWIES